VVDGLEHFAGEGADVVEVCVGGEVVSLIGEVLNGGLWLWGGEREDSIVGGLGLEIWHQSRT
jgi:hypothetical protein